jgi:tetratricopeptide (TPR) repeat protein
VRGLICLILGCSFLLPGLCRAGLYNPAEFARDSGGPTLGPDALPYRQFRDQLRDLLSVNRLGSSRQRSYTENRDRLLAKVRQGAATNDDRIELSFYLIRLRQYDEAIAILSPQSRERATFMVYANLGTAEMLAGRLDRALSALQQVRDVWPNKWPGVNQERLAWYRRAEGYQSRLVRLRYAESVRGGGRASAANTLDDLFGDGKEPVHFVGESGQYEAGILAAEQKSKLPGDAIAIVQQLLVWMPDDTRLYWQLGELYNGAGDIEAARGIFEDCIDNRRFDAPELRAHRQVVREAKPSTEPLVLEPAPEKPAEQPAAAEWLPHTGKLIAVGGAAGLMVVFFLYLQLRELRGRRRRP